MRSDNRIKTGTSAFLVLLLMIGILTPVFASLDGGVGGGGGSNNP